MDQPGVESKIQESEAVIGELIPDDQHLGLKVQDWYDQHQ